MEGDRLLAPRASDPAASAKDPAGAAMPPHGQLLVGVAVGCALVALPLLAAPLVPTLLPVFAAASLAGALLLAAGGFAAARMLQEARRGAAWLAGWPQPVLAITVGALAATVIIAAWPAPPVPAPRMLAAAGAGMVLLAFPVLVLERFCADLSRVLPDGAGLAALLRAVLLVQLALGLVLLLAGSGVAPTDHLVRLPAIFVLLLAAEFVLRGLAALFLPASALHAGRPAARSLLAGAIRLQPARLASLNQALARQFGLDLTRSWALGFIGQALGPVALLLALLAWGLTGAMSLPLDQRAVYERLGQPVEVLGPGLHLRLPWPLGRTRRVERGVLHELALVASAPDRATAQVPIAAEEPPPIAADRLWDHAHAGEATYLIASPAAAGQGFQSVNVDLRLITRVGLSDAAALQAAYGVADPDALVRATAGRLLARYFAARTLAGVLGEDRSGFTEAIRTGVQEALDRLGTGVEIVAVVVEAIHPPPAAAGAWHGVQAAGIRARVAVADEQGAAAKTLAEARIATGRSTDAATAAAAETLAEARADATLFDGDRAAAAAAPGVYPLERWFARLRATLGRVPLLVLDHRLDGTAAPTFDLRGLAPPAATPP
jgi:regulator of protease activity HflC (stomatin/prohibitin superfamily)